MDDTCAVCAEPLEWVAFGPCGHLDICSTCVSRLRFICNDRRCCICKAESDFVFVTKALGEYTTKFNDFAAFSSESKEGRIGSYWFHIDTHSIFDDFEQYRMVKAMCRLSCSMCERDGDQMDVSRGKRGFRSIDQLKGHLFHQHRLVMCSLCLEGRKVFICEQKLYTRGQLNQHIHTGDSEVDGSESERGGFMGHPICEFCRAPFYGDNELYTHMSTDHFTCHICLREHPGQYEYYKNYSDLEVHFRFEHFLCEDESCLAKKFVVFQVEADMKRHTMLEHGGNMSRSKRNSALQIPTSFRYRRANEQDRRRGRGQAFCRDFSEDQMAAIEAGLLEMTVAESAEDTSTGDGSFLQPPENISAGDSEMPSRYRQALSQNHMNGHLGESSFPPLPLATTSSHPKGKRESDISTKNTMADHLRRRNARNGRTPAVSLVSPAAEWPKRRWDNKPMAATSSRAVSDDSPAAHKAENTPQKHISGSSKKSSPSSSRLGGESPGVSDSEFPPVSSTRTGLPAAEEVQTANKNLVERMRASLGFDEGKYGEFRKISVEFRQGLIETREYLRQVQRYGLLHLVHDLARLLPDKQKQNELMDAYNSGFFKENGPKKGKEKEKENIIDTVRRLQSAQKSCDEEVVEVLSKDGYRPSLGKGKAKMKKMQSGSERIKSGESCSGEGGETRGRGRSVWDNRGGQRLIGTTISDSSSSGNRR